jgi:hypothetical protein
MPAKNRSVDVEYEHNLETMRQIEQMGILFKSIRILVKVSPSEATGLARIGAYVADISHNDVDVRNGLLQPYYGMFKEVPHDREI